MAWLGFDWAHLQDIVLPPDHPGCFLGPVALNDVATKKVPECFRAVRQHLKPLLESDAVVKVVHDCRLEAALLLRCCLQTAVDAAVVVVADQQPLGIRLAGVFDTAVAFSTILHRVRASDLSFAKVLWLLVASSFVRG